MNCHGADARPEGESAVGWAKRLVRRSSKSEGGSVPTNFHRIIGEMVGTALCAFAHPTAPETGSARRNRLGAAVVVEAALGLATEPAGLDVFHQQRARAIFGV